MIGRAALLLCWAAIASLGLCAITPKFVDVSLAKGFLSYSELDLERPKNNKYFGSTVADVNRDGFYDLLLCNHAQNPELYFGKADETFRYVDPQLRRRDLHSTAAADMDNDGKLEMIMNTGGSNGLRVNGVPIVYNSRFEPKRFRVQSGDVLGLGDIAHRGRAMSFLDIDADGHLDLLLVNARNQSRLSAHLVYRNTGTGQFVFVNNTGIEEVNARWFHVVDINNDSYPDILFMGFQATELWLGTGGFSFVKDVDTIPQLKDAASARAAAEIDFDNDGDMDLYIARGKPRGLLYDLLLENTGSGYVDVTRKAGLRIPTKHMHVTTGDLNNDGLMDMYISRSVFFEQSRINDLVMINEGDGTFTEKTNTGLETSNRFPMTDGDNANIFDYNGDGFADVLVGLRNMSWLLFENRTPPNRNHYLTVRVGVPRPQLIRPRRFRRKALGALVKVFCGAKVFMQRVGSQGQSHAQSYMDVLHFGLGTCTRVDRIEVHYTGEVLLTRRNVGVDQEVTVGMYFPCPAGFIGINCNERVKTCKQTPPAGGAAAEIVELVGRKCAESPVTPTCAGNIMKNTGFENDLHWALFRSSYVSGTSFSGTRSVQLSTQFSAATQNNLPLNAGVEYRLSCKILDGPVRYKIFDNSNTLVVSDMSGTMTSIPGSAWKDKVFKFTVPSGGTHRIQIAAPNGIQANIDQCTLKSCTSCLTMYCQL